MINLVQKDDVAPICPHCSEKVEDLWFRRLKSNLGVRSVYFCSKCHKVLGVSHRKGFWMG